MQLGYVPTISKDKSLTLDYILTTTTINYMLAAAMDCEIKTMTQLAQRLGLPRSRLYRTLEILGIFDEVRKVCGRRYNMHNEQ